MSRGLSSPDDQESREAAAGVLQDPPPASGDLRQRRFRRLTAASIVLLILASLAAGGLISVGAASRMADRNEARGSNPDLVVLVHGLGRSHFSMMPLEWALEAEGYRVLNWGYSSTCCSIPELADQLATALDEHTPGHGGKVHFVGHSLGNIIIRSLLSERTPTSLGRVVMLAPPNQGSRSAGRFLPIIGWLYPPLAELTPSANSTVRTVTMPEAVEFAVIAGEHDGKVSVNESHLPGERDHAVVPSAHTFIMLRDDVRRLVTTFLESGTFPDA